MTDREPIDPPIVSHTCHCGVVTPLTPGVTRCIGCGVAVGDEEGREG
jgi:hypothetical protein